MLLVPGLVTPPPSFSFLPPPRLQPQVLFLFFWNPVCTKLPDAPCRLPIPTQPGMPPLAKTLWAWVCVVVGGAAMPGNQARSVWSVCLVGERTGGHAPSLPSFSTPPPQAPLIVRPARPAKPVGSFLETGPCVKPAPSLVGENSVTTVRVLITYHQYLKHLPACVHHQTTERGRYQLT